MENKSMSFVDETDARRCGETRYYAVPLMPAKEKKLGDKYRDGWMLWVELETDSQDYVAYAPASENVYPDLNIAIAAAHGAQVYV